MTRQVQAGAYTTAYEKNRCADDDEVKPRYILRCIMQIDDEHLPKIDELLRDKWRADNISFTRQVLPLYYRLECVLDSPRKIFTLKNVIKKYGGKVFFIRFQKCVPDSDVPIGGTAINHTSKSQTRAGWGERS